MAIAPRSRLSNTPRPLALAEAGSLAGDRLPVVHPAEEGVITGQVFVELLADL
jgi:hypothetical protein